MNSISFIGAGRLARVLALSLSRAGWPVSAVASRSAASATALASQIPNCRVVTNIEAAQADLVFLTVPDDSITPVTNQLAWRTGQHLVHCSGATEVAALESAARQGASTGGFHPLQIFSDPASALHHLKGSCVAIEGAPALSEILQAMAHSMGLRTINLPPGSRALYHASAGYVASLMLPLLHEAVQLWKVLGINEADTLQALLPLAKGTLAAAQARGVAGALSGPVSRNDQGVAMKHLKALAAIHQSHAGLYARLTSMQLPLAEQAGRLNSKQVEDWKTLLADSGGMSSP